MEHCLKLLLFGMPKKFKGINSKAEETRARREAVKVAERERKQKEEEDKYWEDNDKHVVKKQQRKEEKDRKRLDAAERKAANQEALKAEESLLKSKASSVRTKMTVADIQAERERKAAQAVANAAQKKKEEESEDVLQENPNQELAAALAAEGAIEARSVEDAIAVLNVDGIPVDRHPEKRMKAAYNAFEEQELPRLKEENPNMRLSQLKQLLRKEWMKSPDNPMNMAYGKRT